MVTVPQSLQVIAVKQLSSSAFGVCASFASVVTVPQSLASVPNEVHQTLFINYLNEWFETATRNIKPSSLQDYASSYKVLAEKFKNKTIGNLTRQYLQEYLYNLAEEGKHRTAKKYKQILHATFELIAEDFGIRNPLNKIKLPYYEVTHAKAFTYEEEKRLMQCCIESPEWKGAMAVLFLFIGTKSEHWIKTDTD